MATPLSKILDELVGLVAQATADGVPLEKSAAATLLRAQPRDVLEHLSQVLKAHRAARA